MIFKYLKRYLYLYEILHVAACSANTGLIGWLWNPKRSLNDLKEQVQTKEADPNSGSAFKKQVLLCKHQ